MLANDIEIGQRVLVKQNDMTALVVGRPEYYTPRAKLVRIKYENSTRYEYMINNQLEHCLLKSNTLLTVAHINAKKESSNA